MVPGKYYLVETKTLEGYEKIEEPIEVSVKLNEKYNVTVNNAKEVKKEVEKPKIEVEKTEEEVSVQPVVKKLPKTGM